MEFSQILKESFLVDLDPYAASHKSSEMTAYRKHSLFLTCVYLSFLQKLPWLNCPVFSVFEENELFIQVAVGNETPFRREARIVNLPNRRDSCALVLETSASSAVDSWP